MTLATERLAFSSPWNNRALPCVEGRGQCPLLAYRSCDTDAMRSPIDWLSDFYSPKRNRYLRLSEADRTLLVKRQLIFFLVVVIAFATWRWLLT